MFAKLFESLYLKVFVGIIVNRATTDVSIETYSKENAVDHLVQSFETTSVSAEMLEFINKYTNESPYHYISILDTSTDQGALPTCDKSKVSYYYDLNGSEYKCSDKKWTYYTSKNDMYSIEKTYKQIGIDFIFSPFSILSNFFEDKIDGHIAMYLIIQDKFISVSVFEESQLIYAEHTDIELSQDPDDVLISNDEDGIDLDIGIDLDGIDDIDDIDDLDDLDDFGDIEDLDSLEDIDQFAEEKDVEEEFYESIEDTHEDESDDDTFSEDYERFSIIKNSISSFYTSEKYESKFIENIYIADGVSTSSDLKKYLEEEMFLNVYIRRVDLNFELCKLARMELKA